MCIVYNNSLTLFGDKAGTKQAVSLLSFSTLFLVWSGNPVKLKS